MQQTKEHTKEQGNALHEIIAQRYAEVKEIRTLGVDPYPARKLSPPGALCSCAVWVKPLLRTCAILRAAYSCM
mgnify:CR=1 FL=1